MLYRPFAITLYHSGNQYEGKIVPLNKPNCKTGYPCTFAVTLNGLFRGIFEKDKNGWQSTSLCDDGLVVAIGNYISDWYQAVD